MQTRKRNFNFGFFILAGTAILLLILQVAALNPNITTPVERMELSARDLLMRLRGEQTPSQDIVIVAIDDESFNYTGYQWPWPRSYFAEIVDQINAGGAKVIGVDVLLFEPDKEAGNDQLLADALGKANNVVLLAQIYGKAEDQFIVHSLQQPLTPYQEVMDGVGIPDVERDKDAIVRSFRAFDSYDDRVFYHWTFEIARLYLGVDGPSNLTPTGFQFNGADVPLDGDAVLIDYAGPAGTYTTYSASSVALGDVLEQDPNAFKDKIVLIGATTITLQDIFPTPFSARFPTPGVEVVANAIDTIINGKYIRETPPWMNFLFTIGAAIIAALISRSRRPSLTITLLTVTMLGHAIVGGVVFARERLILPLVVPEAMLFLGVVLPTLEQAVSQELEKRRVRNLFGRFISPEMVDMMMKTQDINSLNKRSDVSIIFSDIRGFTTLSEKLAPEDVVALLNPYLEAMSEVIYKHGGTVDKYEGDAIIAFFGEPIPYKDHAVRALRASMDMRKALEKLRHQWAKEGRPSSIEMGIGINSGEVFVGMVGSSQRINYTVIGDNANLASRLQDLTKTYAWPILISESTYEQVKDEFETELVDAVTVKGKTKPVNVYKVIGRRGATEAEKLQSWQK